MRSRGKPLRRKALDLAFHGVTTLCALAAVSILGVIVGLILARGVDSLSIGFLTSQLSEGGAAGGIGYHILGTLILITTAAACAIPVAAGSAILLQAYLRDGVLRRAGEGVLHALNGVPSIVFGLFGLAIFVQWLGMRKSWLAGGMILGLMILPTVTVAFLEKLRAIPGATIEAAFGLGLGRSAVVRDVLFPQAASGLVTGALLGLGRAAGETAPILFTAAIFSGATFPTGVVDSPVLALPYHIFILAQDTFDPRGVANAWGTATVLLALVFLMSALALPLRMRIHEEARRV